MPIEIDDVSVRIIGNNFKGFRFYDDARALRAEIYLDEQNRLNIGAATLVTGGSTPSGAPVAFAQAPFLTLQAHPDLLAERVFAPGGGLSASDGGPGGVYTLSVDSSVVRTNRTLTAGAGLIGGGDLSANRTFDVGAGTGITVNANDVAVNVGHAFTWTAGHTFQATIQARTILPELTDTYDLGSSTKLWRKGWLSELDAVLFAQNAVTVIGGWLIVAKGEGVLGTDLGSGAGDTTADLGTTANISAHATTGDIILFRAAGQVEYMKVTSGSGPTWTVTRDLDGSGRNAWPAGSVFVNLGYGGTGRIELNASDTPRISIVRQGTTYNAQTEDLRLGDLNGNWGYASATIGLAIGEYAANKPNLTYDSTNGLRLRTHTTTVLQLDITGNADITGKLRMPGTGSAITIGSTPPTSASAGTGIWIDRTGMYGLASNVVQAKFDATTGKITAGAGNVVLDANGVGITLQENYQPYSAINNYLGSTLYSTVFGTAGTGNNSLAIEMQSISSVTSDIRVITHAGSGASNERSVISLQTKFNGAIKAGIYISHVTGVGSGLDDLITLEDAEVYVRRGLNVGFAPNAATGAGSGSIRLSGSIERSTVIGARVWRNTTQSINNNTITAIQFNSESGTGDFDNNNIHDNSTNNTRLTAPVAGKYWVHGSIRYASNATGVRNAIIRKGGSTLFSNFSIAAVNGAATVVETAAIVDLAANEYVELCAFQNSGGSLNVESNAEYSPKFEMFRIV